MFQVNGRAHRSCDGVRRRDFLRIGYLGLGGLSLGQFLQTQARAGSSESAGGRQARDTAVIYIEMAGGPSHFETYDPKPDAPAEYRGPLGTVGTCLPGVRFSEMMVEQASIADKLAVIRSVHHNSSSHQTSAHLVQTGYYLRDRQNRQNEMPCSGAITARVRQEAQAAPEGLPSYVAVPSIMRYGDAAFLGKGFNPFITGGDPNKDNFAVKNLDLVGKLSFDRLADRRGLLSTLDTNRRLMDNRGVSDALDQFTHEAFEMVAGDRARAAFDIHAEPDAVRNRYGRSTVGQSLLLARRLVEAGVPFVTARVGGWDDHQKIVQRLKQKAPQFDRGVTALINDLHERGMQRNVLIVAMGEFGRTPRVNRTAGRDHWGSVMSVMLSGGELQMGQIIGASSRRGEKPDDRPYRPENILATVYRHLGIDPGQTFVDHAGRPRYVLENASVVEELV